MAKTSSRHAGFTLLELLIVIIILGILAALALPQYLKTVERGRGAEAIVNLGTIRTGELNYYAENRVYTPDLDLLDIDNPNFLPPPPDGTRLFDYTLSVPAPDTFTAMAQRIRPDGTIEIITINEKGRITRVTSSP
ncbi:MAG: prepilin-type N-terminal cleavage/methylation domain-containing protein [Candidatus Omnitrophica bacterium]|nr:prepilin-type N-terminal cleavage/methylation domain-containing protein [Candidatus Omnitrophota bacterium]